MAYFQPFKKASIAPTPKFIAAEIGQAEAENAEKARINEIRAGNQAGLAGGYEMVTSKMEKDPIAEALRNGWDKMVPDTSAGGVTADVMPTAAPDAILGGAEMGGAGTGIEGSAPWLEAMGTTGQLAPGAAEAAALGADAAAAGLGETAAATTAATTGSGGLMAGLGTAMPWLGAAMAAYALLNR